MTRLNKRGHNVDIQILDNYASQAYRINIEDKWNYRFQIVPRNVHQRHAAERGIQTFKAHFLSILLGVSASFPKS